jgi:hypothetical protein
MVGRNVIKAGEAYILIRALDKASGPINDVARNFMRLGEKIRNIGLGIGALGGVIAGSLIPPLIAASDLQEQKNKFFQIFGTRIGRQVEQSLAGIARETGRSMNKMYKFASSFGGLLKGYGASTAAAAKFSTQMVSLGVDFSSFNDIMDDTREGSMRRFLSALSGSAEVLDQYGVAAKEGALGPMLQKMFQKGVRGATELEKAVARGALIMKAMLQQGAVGDAARTMHQLANAWRNVKDAAWDAKVVIGEALLPVVGPLVRRVHIMMLDTQEWAKTHKGIIQVLFATGGVLFGIGVSMVVIGTGVQVWGAGMAVVSLLTKNTFLWLTKIRAVMLSSAVWKWAAILAAAAYAMYLSVLKSARIGRAWGSMWERLTGRTVNKDFDDLLSRLGAEWGAGELGMMWQEFKDIGLKAWHEIGRIAGQTFGRIEGFIGRLARSISEPFTQAFFWIKNEFDKFLSYIFTSTGDMFATFAGWGEKFFSAVGLKGTSAWFSAHRAEFEATSAKGSLDRKRNQKEYEEWSRDSYERRKSADAAGSTAGSWLEEYNSRKIKEIEDRQKQRQKQVEQIATREPWKDVLPGGGVAPLPQALEKGTVAAAQKALANQRNQELVDLVDLTREGNEQRDVQNSLIREWASLIGEGV